MFGIVVVAYIAGLHRYGVTRQANATFAIDVVHIEAYITVALGPIKHHYIIVTYATQSLQPVSDGMLRLCRTKGPIDAWPKYQFVDYNLVPRYQCRLHRGGRYAKRVTQKHS